MKIAIIAFSWTGYTPITWEVLHDLLTAGGHAVTCLELILAEPLNLKMSQVPSPRSHPFNKMKFWHWPYRFMVRGCPLP